MSGDHTGDHTQITTTSGTDSHAAGHDVAHHAADHGADHERPEDWGWNGEFGKTARVAGVISAIVILVLLIGNHQGRVEDLWLIGIAAIIFGMIIRDALRRRRSWRN